MVDALMQAQDTSQVAQMVGMAADGAAQQQGKDAWFGSWITSIFGEKKGSRQDRYGDKMPGMDMQMNTCMDSPQYKDAAGYDCASWASYDCTKDPQGGFRYLDWHL